MTKQQFIDSLQWIVGQPPSEWDGDDKFMSEKYWDYGLPPMAIENKNGELFVLGHLNLNGGVCDCCRELNRKDIVRYAYLYEDDK